MPGRTETRALARDKENVRLNLRSFEESYHSDDKRENCVIIPTFVLTIRRGSLGRLLFHASAAVGFILPHHQLLMSNVTKISPSTMSAACENVAVTVERTPI